ncbi:MAG: hypothetical protein HUU21_11945 [Polyangiaceae bacterium]|nr:hypothetical protein [Polyangiaceae bacterium]
MSILSLSSASAGSFGASPLGLDNDFIEAQAGSEVEKQEHKKMPAAHVKTDRRMVPSRGVRSSDQGPSGERRGRQRRLRRVPG